jgi:hypothetical protein
MQLLNDLRYDLTMETKLPKCKLIGIDGNVFAIIGAVSACLKKAGQRERATEFTRKAMSSDSYDAVLRLCGEYVEVR